MPILKSTDFLPDWADNFFTGSFMPDCVLKAKTSIPAVNIDENDEQITLHLAIPGMKKKDLKLDLTHKVLTISAEKTEKCEEKEGADNHVSHKEFCYSSFSRSFTLPETIKEDGIVASYKDGILTINIPKKEEAKNKVPKQIEII